MTNVHRAVLGFQALRCLNTEGEYVGIKVPVTLSPKIETNSRNTAARD